MSFRGLLIQCLIFLSATAAQAQVCPSTGFGTPSARAHSVEQTSDMLRALTAQIEAVPPSEAEYIDREERAALDAANRERFNIVYGNRFYAAHQIAKAAREMMSNLTASAQEVRLKERTILLSATLSKHVDLVEAFNQYVERDNKLARPILKSGSRSVAYDLVILRSNLLRNLQCNIQMMREP